jgi:hypothetical protein
MRLIYSEWVIITRIAIPSAVPATFKTAILIIIILTTNRDPTVNRILCCVLHKRMTVSESCYLIAIPQTYIKWRSHYLPTFPCPKNFMFSIFIWSPCFTYSIFINSIIFVFFFFCLHVIPR